MIKPPLRSIKDRNGMDLTEAEDIKIDIKERWQEYTEESTKIFTTQLHLIKAMVFPIVMCGYELD